MLLRLVACLCLCLVGRALADGFTNCTHNRTPVPLEKISFDGCEDFPCRLKYKTDVRLIYQLTVPHRLNKIDKEVWLKFGDKPMRLARIMDGCEFIKCPVEAGQTVQYSKIVAMNPGIPMGLHNYEINFKDGETGEPLACGKYQLIFYDGDDEKETPKEN